MITEPQQAAGGAGAQPWVDPVGARIRDSMFLFLQLAVSRFRNGGALQYVFDQLRRVSDSHSWSTVVIKWGDYSAHDEAASVLVESNFLEYSPYLHEGLQLVLQEVFAEAYANRGVCHPQIAFSEVPRCFTVRNLRAAMVGQLCSISGTVTRTSQVRPELIVGVFRCNDCGTESQPVAQQFQYQEPPACRNPQCENTTRFQLIPNHRLTQFGDWQKLRVQEDANHIPVGCMPRSLEIIARNDAVEVAKPGDRVAIAGCAIVVPEVAKLFNQANRREVQRQLTGQRGEDGGNGGGGEANQGMEGATGLKALGVRDLNYRLCFLASSICDHSGDSRKMSSAVKDHHDGDSGDGLHDDGSASGHDVTPGERDKIIQLRSRPNIFLELVRCVAPHVHRHDLIKTGLLLQMVGGVSKRTIEGISLRGDINVCIVGDPSTAKSQFLKWISVTVPRGIYTSGKASTASGLTATVTRDADTGERTIEAGALMLSDQGVCCIDEFDKMDIKDQVAIHEAMEQQTISIAKAGIKATLNAKTSLLAALNPIGGKYDRRKPLQKNIAMTAPIMSRFDLMFCVVDDASDTTDKEMADRLLSVHRHGDKAIHTALTPEEFQLYVGFARTRRPRLTDAACELITRAYKTFRVEDSLSHRSKVYRVTTRLLESMIRLSEAVAKVYLSDDVLPAHVKIGLEVMKESLTTVDVADIELAGAAELEDDAPPGETAAVASAAGGDGDEPPPQGEGSTTAAARGDGAQPPKEKQRAAKRGAAAASDQSSAATSTRRQQQHQQQDAAAAKQKPGKHVVVSADQYFRTVNRLVTHLHSLGDQRAPTRQELIAWYMDSVPSAQVSHLEAELKLVTLTIQRLLKEGKLLEAEVTEGEGRRIYLDPNYNPDSSFA